MLIAKPSFLFQNSSHLDIYGLVAAIMGSLMVASCLICMRRLRLHDVHFSALIFVITVVSAIVNAFMVPLFSNYKLPTTNEEWVCTFLVGVFRFLGQSLLAMALRYYTIF